MEYEKIYLELDGGVNIQLELTNPSLIRCYKNNPNQFNNYVAAFLCEAFSDIEAVTANPFLGVLIGEMNNKNLRKKEGFLENIINSQLN